MVDHVCVRRTYVQKPPYVTASARAPYRCTRVKPGAQLPLSIADGDNNVAYHHLPAANLLEPSVPVPQHPGIKLSDLHGAASHHDEAGLALGNPSVEIEQAEAVANLVKQDVDVV